MKKNISRISLGVRHRRSFRVPEIAGTITDYIVYDQNSPFETGFFQATDALIDNLENKGRVLIGADGKSSFVVDTDSLILNLAAKDFDKTLKRTQQEIVPFLKKIFKEFNIENINRVGIVFEFKSKDKDRVTELISSLTSNKYSHIDRLDLRFSEKDVDVKSLVKKDLLDYANSIVFVSKTEDEVTIKFDYQFHYSPEIENINDIDFDQFIMTASEKLEGKLFSWFSQNEK